MSWTKLAPIAKSTGRPMASAAIVVNKDGVPKISLVLADSLHSEFGRRTKVDIAAGDAGSPHEGQLLVEFAKAGAFDIKLFGKGGGRVFVPAPEWLPAHPAANLPCTLGERTADSVVVKLPLDEWRRTIAARAPKAIAVGAGGADQPGGPTKAGNGQPVDAVEYLAGKGVKISRLASSRFAVDGETKTMGEVLNLVNRHRKAADLDPLPAHKVF